MNQKKHLNAIAALEASKDAEPGNLWQRAYCHDAVCERCYGIRTLCRGIINCSGLGLHVSEVRAALQSGLGAYHKRKAEKAERRAIEAANSPDSQTITIPRDPAVWDATKGTYPVILTHNADEDAMGKFTHSPVVPENWTPMTLAEVLPLIFDGPRQFADEARRQGWKKT